jgi:AcrR family transcriptional regulator
MLYDSCTENVKWYVAGMTDRTIRSRRDEYAETTRLALLAAGREAFARDGYHATGVEAIARAVRVTRGAFYHHFKDKTALFDAVVVDLQKEAAAAIEKRAKTKKEIWDRLSEGLDAFLDTCSDPIYGRIVVQQGLAVLGDERFREIEEAYPMALLTATLDALKRRGELSFDNVRVLARMIDAMVCKLAEMILQADNPKIVRREGREVIRCLLEGIRS